MPKGRWKISKNHKDNLFWMWSRLFFKRTVFFSEKMILCKGSHEGWARLKRFIRILFYFFRRPHWVVEVSVLII